MKETALLEWLKVVKGEFEKLDVQLNYAIRQQSGGDFTQEEADALTRRLNRFARGLYKLTKPPT